MNKLFLTIGFMLTLPFYFHDGMAGWIQGIGGNLWISFFDSSFFLYPLYLAIFLVPLFLVISLFRMSSEYSFKKCFIWLLYGFLISSVLFLVLALLAISQFRFTQ